MSAGLEVGSESRRNYRSVECSGMVVSQKASTGSSVGNTPGPFLRDAWDLADANKGSEQGLRPGTGGDEEMGKSRGVGVNTRMDTGADLGVSTNFMMTGPVNPENPNEANDEPLTSPIQKSPRQRDPIFWTELELRRLSNLVASCIHSSRYVGNSKDAREERRKMRTWIDAMKRKAMRILHRAETLASSNASGTGGFSVFGTFGNSALPMSVKWPGIDPTITDPVALGEEYVRLVEDYYAVLATEEEQADAEPGEDVELKQANETSVAKQAQGNNADDGGGSSHDGANRGDEIDDWEREDDIAYRQAIQRERDSEGDVSNGDAREKLLGDGPLGDGVRRRRGLNDATESTQKSEQTQDETLKSDERMVHEDLTSNLVNLVGQLRESVTANQQKLDNDNHVLEETENSVDRNLSSLGAQSKRLQRFTQYSASSTLWVYIAIAFIVLMFIIVLLILL